MSAITGSELAQARSRLGVVARKGSQAEVDEARRDFATAKLAAVVEETVAKAPPLTADQVQRLTALLNGDAHA